MKKRSRINSNLKGFIMTYADITDTIKQTYCPRQYFYMDPAFKDTTFFKRHCGLIPCRGDIECNRAACWTMLTERGPYVHDDLIKVSQKPVCPSDFFGRLAEYAHDCGAESKKIFTKYMSEFGCTEFCAHTCPMGAVECFGKKFKGQQFFENTCWPNLLAELKVKQK